MDNGVTPSKVDQLHYHTHLPGVKKIPDPTNHVNPQEWDLISWLVVFFGSPVMMFLALVHGF